MPTKTNPYGVCAGRITVADLCSGDSIPGTSNAIVTDVLTSAMYKRDIKEGKKQQIERACSTGDYAVNNVLPDVMTTTGMLELDFPILDRFVESLFIRGSLLLNGTDVSGRIEQNGALSTYYTIELWEENLIDAVSCPQPAVLTGTTTIGSATITAIASTTLVVIGGLVTGTGIPAGAYVVSKTGTSVTLNATALATATGTVSIRFQAYLPYKRHVYGMGRPKPIDQEFKDSIRGGKGMFNLTGFRPPAGWLGPLKDFPTGITTQVDAWRTANPSLVTMHIDFDESILPVSQIGYIAVL